MSRPNNRTDAQRIVFNEGTTAGRGLSAPNGSGDSETVSFIGASAAFSSILETIQTIASRKCSVIITGETGTGKEMVARQIHQNSDRKDNVFVPVDCTTLTGQLFESQLFGHVKGAFTGAIDNTYGFFRAGDKGTVFLDEISEIPLELQAKLLRVLQENSVTPLGSTKSYPIDVRVICATNRDLRQMVRDNEFRADLYYRLNVVTLDIPPLNERKEDILLLANHFLEKQAELYCEPKKKLSDDAEKILLNYSWPGNVREVSNAMERAFVMSSSELIAPDALPPEIVMAEYTRPTDSRALTLEAVQRKLISDTLEMTGGRKIAAAKILGIERRRLNRMIEKLNIAIDKLENDISS